MRKGNLVGSDNKYAAGHIMSYHDDLGSDNTYPDNDAQFYPDIFAI